MNRPGADFLAEATRRWPDRPALTDGERRWTFGELDAWVSELSAALEGQGVGAGDVVPLIVDPTAEAVATLFAVVRAGAAAAPLNPRLTEHEREAALEALTGADPGDAQVVLWTSGSEGSPAGVALTADNLRASAEGVAARLALEAGDRWLASLSVAHVGGYALVVRCALTGSELVALGALDTERLSEALERHGATHVSLVPTQLRWLLDKRGASPPPPSLRCVLIGGAHTSAEILDRALASGWPVALTYGKTETTSQVATAPPELVRRVPGSVGAPLDGLEVRVTDDGEMLVRGPTVARAYLGGDRTVVDADGWHATGDLGHLDREGLLWVTGRRSERIVSGGVTVDALEVERELRSHPAVIEVCVVGIPDPEWGESVAALVVGVEGELDLEELAEYADTRLGPAKRPRQWMRRHELPLGANGKVDRSAVRAAFGGEG